MFFYSTQPDGAEHTQASEIKQRQQYQAAITEEALNRLARDLSDKHRATTDYSAANVRNTSQPISRSNDSDMSMGRTAISDPLSGKTIASDPLTGRTTVPEQIAGRTTTPDLSNHHSNPSVLRSDPPNHRSDPSNHRSDPFNLYSDPSNRSLNTAEPSVPHTPEQAHMQKPQRLQELEDRKSLLLKLAESVKGKKHSKHRSAWIEQALAEVEREIWTLQGNDVESGEMQNVHGYSEDTLSEAKNDFTLTDNYDKINTRSFALSLRRSPFYILTEADIQTVLQAAKEIGIQDVSIFRFNEGAETGFVEDKACINVRGNIFPDMEGTTARDRMSVRAVLAHEYYGHYRNHPSEYPIGDWRDEFRASYDAAIKTPNLTDEERRYLMIDAYDRAKEVGAFEGYNEKARRIIYGF